MQIINATLQKAETMLAEQDCRDTPGGDFDAWSEVTLNGAGLLSLNYGSNWYCDGMAHPWWVVHTLLFDLNTGEQIDPLTFLPEALRPPPEDDDYENFTIEKALAAIKPLTDLYLARLALDPTIESAELNDMDCVDVLTHDLLSFRVWPDAKAHALMLEPSGMIYIDTPCIATVPLSVPVLSELGASPRLIRALDN